MSFSISPKKGEMGKSAERGLAGCQPMAKKELAIAAQLPTFDASS
jgi:hypothetical protein